MNTFFFDDVQYPEGLFGGKDFFNPIIYSTEEREVGVWTDGKPLYQKTFDCGALLNAQTKEVSFTEDMETATIIDAFAMSTSEGYVISLPDVVPNYVAGSVRIYVSKTAKKIYIYSQADMRTYDKSYVTIQYTKTTDVAGSGQYTTLGVPNVHYSTDEQVIGTWIDGKPIYQKSYQLAEPLSVRANAWVSVTGIELQNVDTPINCIVSDGRAVQSWVCVDFKDTPISIAHSRNVAITVQNFTFQYTKTTD